MTQQSNQSSTWNSAQNAPSEQCSYLGAWVGGTSALLGGLGIGALLMYLFDPEEGRERRGYLAEASGDVLDRASHALGHAGDALSSAWESVSDTTSDVGDRAARQFSRGSTRKMLSRAQRSVSDAASDLADSAGGLFS